MKIIFFGSTDFSLPILKKIYEYYGVAGVVISKPKPKGRGLTVDLPELGKWAIANNIKLFDPENPNEISFIENLALTTPDIFVLSAYGHILSGDLLKIPKKGGINIHPSLLPKYRGAAPIQRAIMAGEKKTGITIFFMDEKIDHGKIIMQKEIDIDKNDTYGSLSHRLSLLGAEMVIEALRLIENNGYEVIEQNESEMTYAPKIKKEETVINWNDNSERIYNLIRALNPAPGARTQFRNNELIILEAEIGDRKIEPGVIHIENKKLYIGTKDGSMILKTLKPENRRVMTALDFINGYRFKNGEKL
uniref:Methionyl-tRNA formyltransferase n=1 Tax=candidate division WOR-3 bacterium TaxID=2052148 RepID=A0A7V0Z3F9_UNCW3